MDVAKYLPFRIGIQRWCLMNKAAPTLNSMLTTSLAHHFPTAVLVQEQRYYDCKPLFHIMMDGSTPEKTILDRRRMEIGYSVREESGNFSSASCYILPSFKKEVFSTSKRAVLLAVSYESYETNLDESSNSSEVPTSSSEFSFEKENIVKSTRLCKRKGVVRRKRLKPTSPKIMEVVYRKHLWSTPLSKKKGMPNGRIESQLLNPAEEYELVLDVQHLIRLEKVENKLRSQFGRKPVLVEWAKAAGVSCHALNSQLNRGYKSKEKLVYTHFGVVVHVAQQYQGLGLDVEDLLQDGCKGLIKGIERFNPKFGCRLVTYAYWWIKNSVANAIYRNSRIIRLPENLHAVLAKVAEVKRLFGFEGVHHPTDEDIATRVGITVAKLEKVYYYSRTPILVPMHKLESMEDPESEIIIVSIAKQLMRQHIHRLLNTLTPNEKGILRLRYGFGGGEPQRLAEIGDIFGLSKQRIQQLESRAMNKLRECVESQELESYKEFLI